MSVKLMMDGLTISDVVGIATGADTIKTGLIVLARHPTAIGIAVTKFIRLRAGGSQVVVLQPCLERAARCGRLAWVRAGARPVGICKYAVVEAISKVV